MKQSISFNFGDKYFFMKKIIFVITCISIFAACNSGDKKESEGAKTKDEGMNHMNMKSMDIPEVPAVPDGAKVFFKNLQEGATISSPYKVEMGVEKMRVDTTGPIVAGSGHFHIFIDAEDSLAWGTIVPKDDNHLHYGKGQTEDNLTLTPGKHKLTLQFADGLHRSYGGKLAATVNVNVKK